MSYKLAIRKQYIFNTDKKTIARVFNKLVNFKEITNIVAILLLKKKHSYLVKMVVGLDDPNENIKETMIQNKRLRNILRFFKIKYKITNVIQLFNLGSLPHGSFRTVYVALICKGVDIIGIYLGEQIPGEIISVFVEVAKKNLIRSINILKNIDVNNQNKFLCIK